MYVCVYPLMCDVTDVGRYTLCICSLQKNILKGIIFCKNTKCHDSGRHARIACRLGHLLKYSFI